MFRNVKQEVLELKYRKDTRTNSIGKNEMRSVPFTRHKLLVDHGFKCKRQTLKHTEINLRDNTDSEYSVFE